jgi:hypothetical protein
MMAGKRQRMNNTDKQQWSMAEDDDSCLDTRTAED